jgi:hypothetical protein
MRWQDVADRVKYKPGWKIEMQRPLSVTTNDLQLMVLASFPNSCGSTPPTVQVAQSVFLPLEAWERMEDEVQLEWIRHAVWSLERHEADEWFKYMGTVVNDPHHRDKASPPFSMVGLDGMKQVAHPAERQHNADSNHD